MSYRTLVLNLYWIEWNILFHAKMLVNVHNKKNISLSPFLLILNLLYRWIQRWMQMFGFNSSQNVLLPACPGYIPFSRSITRCRPINASYYAICFLTFFLCSHCWHGNRDTHDLPLVVFSTILCVCMLRVMYVCRERLRRFGRDRSVLAHFMGRYNNK